MKLSEEKNTLNYIGELINDPILKVVVELGSNKSESFIVYKGMNISKALEKFSKKHHIASVAAKQLKERVMKETNSQKVQILR